MSVTVQYSKAHRLILSGLNCDCPEPHRPITQDIYMDNALLARLPVILKRREMGGKALLVCDENTYQAAGKQAQQALKDAHMPCSVLILRSNGVLTVNEAALGEIMMNMSLDTEWFLGIGAGTVTGLTRLAAAVTERPYVCVPTAPSTDGYPMSFGRALRRGENVLLRANAPEIVLCDLDVLNSAPVSLRQAGFGRMLCAYLAQADWLSARLLSREGFCPRCAAMPAEAADRMFAAAETSNPDDPKLTRILMETLLIAGLAQDICHKENPMSCLAQDVARKWRCACADMGQNLLPVGTFEGVAALNIWPRYLSFAAGGSSHIYGRGCPTVLREAISHLPSPESIRNAMVRLGCPVAPEQLGLDAQKALIMMEQTLHDSYIV